MNNSIENLSLAYHGTTHIGMVRTENQDALGKYPLDNSDLSFENGHIFIVADGMGGHAGGRLASSTAVEEMIGYFSRYHSGTTEEIIKNAIEAANNAIYRKAQSSVEYNKMGTTCVVLVIRNNVITIGHVGDSRIYLIENDTIEQLTADHTQVQEMLKRGILTLEEAAKHPSRSVLARALGVDAQVECDIKGGIPLKPGRTFVLCTDGLAKVTDSEIKEIVSSNNPEDACSRLVNLANDRGGKDNVTVQVIKLLAKKELSFIPEEKKKKKHGLSLFLILTILGVIFFSREIVDIFTPETQDTPAEPAVMVDTLPVVMEAADIKNDAIVKADEQFSRGRLEKALEIYESILSDEPMHLAALNGVNRVLTIYAAKADELKDEGNFSSALGYYRKINQLKPGNKKIIDNIILCENQLKFNSLPDVPSAADDSLIIEQKEIKAE